MSDFQADMGAAGLPAADPDKLLLEFASLGENCEFGFVQRQFGIEPLGLFRFAGTNYDSLMRALEHDFAGVGDSAHTRFEVWDGEYVIFDSRFGFHTHTWIKPETIPAERFAAAACRRMQFLVRTFREDAAGERILVRASKPPLAMAQIRDLHRALRRYGPAVLLVVTEAAEGVEAGTVEWAEEGLLLGSISRFGHRPATDSWEIAFGEWFAICRQAYLLKAAARRERETGSAPAADSGPAAVLRGFAPLGENGEFGLVQRHFGCEPLGLLRFATTGLDGLLRALAEDMVGIGEAERTEISVGRDGCLAFADRRYGMLTPTGVAAQGADRALFRQRVRRRQQLLVRLFRDAAGGERIMLRVDREQPPLARIHELHAALCRYGPARLLHVSEATDAAEANTIERVGPGVLLARIRRLGAPDAGGEDIAYDIWLALCTQAQAMFRQDRQTVY